MTARVAILTGRSDPSRTGLPPDQRAFLEAVTPASHQVEPQGYPFLDNATGERPVPLPIAAYRNARVWLGSRVSPVVKADAHKAIARLQARNIRAVITGSCGLDLLRAGGGVGNLCVIALGPVGPDPKEAEVNRIVGEKDFVSRSLSPIPPDHWVPGGHMDYWTCPETQRLVAGLLAERLP